MRHISGKAHFSNKAARSQSGTCFSSRNGIRPKQLSVYEGLVGPTALSILENVSVYEGLVGPTPLSILENVSVYEGLVGPTPLSILENVSVYEGLVGPTPLSILENVVIYYWSSFGKNAFTSRCMCYMQASTFLTV